jgi:hypothetical protein
MSLQTEAPLENVAPENGFSLLQASYEAYLGEQDHLHVALEVPSCTLVMRIFLSLLNASLVQLL